MDVDVAAADGSASSCVICGVRVRERHLLRMMLVTASRKVEYKEIHAWHSFALSECALSLRARDGDEGVDDSVDGEPEEKDDDVVILSRCLHTMRSSFWRMREKREEMFVSSAHE